MQILNISSKNNEKKTSLSSTLNWTVNLFHFRNVWKCLFKFNSIDALREDGFLVFY